MYWSAGLVALVPTAGGDGDVDRPVASAGEVAVIEVAELTMNPLAATEPKSTTVAPV